MSVMSRVVWAAALVGVTLTADPARAQECLPKCRTGYACAAGKCIPACNPPCAAGELCSPHGQCVSACNPACPAGELCSPQGECVSACNPPCAQGERCNASGECQASAVAPTPVVPPPAAPAPAAAAPPAPQAAPTAAPTGNAGRAGFLQAGAVIGRFSYSGTYDNGDAIEGSGMLYGVEAAGGLQMSPKFRLGAGLQYFTLPSPEGTNNGKTVEADTGRGGVLGAYLAWGGNSGLLVDGIFGYGGSGTDDQFGGWGFGLFPGIGYQSSGPVRFSILARVYVMPTSSDSGESGTFSGFQAVASLGAF